MKPEFNNGFITALALFLEHKNIESHVVRNKDKIIIGDYRLYGASDHLYNLEIPADLPHNIRLKIGRLVHNCLKHRLFNFKDSEFGDKMFKEAENILAKIDQEIFKTKKVIMRYR